MYVDYLVSITMPNSNAGNHLHGIHHLTTLFYCVSLVPISSLGIRMFRRSFILGPRRRISCFSTQVRFIHIEVMGPSTGTPLPPAEKMRL